MGIKKMLIVIVMGCAFLMNAVQVSAAQDSEHILEEDLQEKVLRVLSSVAEENNDTLYGIEGIDYSAVTLGKRIPSYNIVDGQLEVSEAEIYPVIVDGKMISHILVAWDEKNGWYAQLDSSFASDEIVNFVQDKPFAYIYGDEEPFVFSQGNIYSIYEDKLFNEEAVNEISLSGNGVISDLNSEFTEYLHIIGENIPTIECSKIEEYIKLNVYDYLANKPVALAASNVVNLNVPIIQQPKDTKICWAISSTSIINYVLKYNWNYKQVLNLFNNGINKGLSIDTVVANMNQHCNLNYEIAGRKPTDKRILKRLRAGYPVYGSFKHSSGNHAAVIRGCNKNDGTFSVMNPTENVEFYTTGTYVSGVEWYFYFGGVKYVLRKHAARSF